MTVINLETELREMSERSVLFRMIKEEMLRRGHWKNLDRGSKPPKASQFSRLSTQPKEAPRVRDESEFSDWGS